MVSCERARRPRRRYSASPQPGHVLWRPVPRRSRSCGSIRASRGPPSAGSRTPAAPPQRPPGAGAKAHLLELGARVLSVRPPYLIVLEGLRALSRPPRPHSSSPACSTNDSRRTSILLSEGGAGVERANIGAGKVQEACAAQAVTFRREGGAGLVTCHARDLDLVSNASARQCRMCEALYPV